MIHGIKKKCKTVLWWNRLCLSASEHRNGGTNGFFFTTKEALGLTEYWKQENGWTNKKKTIFRGKTEYQTTNGFTQGIFLWQKLTSNRGLRHLRRFTLRYLGSHFDKIGVPQMNIGTYKQHVFLITNLDKVTKNYAWAKCQARFTTTCNLRWHAEVWCVKESKSSHLKLLMKKRFMERGICSKSSLLVETRGQMAWGAYLPSNVRPQWG